MRDKSPAGFAGSARPLRQGRRLPAIAVQGRPKEPSQPLWRRKLIGSVHMLNLKMWPVSFKLMAEAHTVAALERAAALIHLKMCVGCCWKVPSYIFLDLLGHLAAPDTCKCHVHPIIKPTQHSRVLCLLSVEHPQVNSVRCWLSPLTCWLQKEGCEWFCNASVGGR